MTEDQLEEAIEIACEDIDQSAAMSTRATQQQSVDFLNGVIEHCTTYRNTIMQEMEG